MTPDTDRRTPSQYRPVGDEPQFVAADSVSACPTCKDGTVIPNLGCPVYGVSMSEDEDWIEILWQGYTTVVNGEEIKRLGEHPSLLIYRDPPVADGDVDDPPTRYVATLRTHIWGRAEETAILTLEGKLPEPVVLLTDDEPATATRDDLVTFAQRAIAVLCDLSTARDERVLAHFPPDKRW
jgi:hypothetical protein